MEKQTGEMLFDRYKEKMTKECGKSEGYIYISGVGIQELLVDRIENIDEVNKCVKEALNR